MMDIMFGVIDGRRLHAPMPAAAAMPDLVTTARHAGGMIDATAAPDLRNITRAFRKVND